MSTKKYLSLEEAAAELRIKAEELIRLREKGDVRGFADRGTWKFKAEDVSELKRRRQPDSNPEVPLIDDDDELGRQPTIITKGRGATSDSDVRLVPDDKLKAKLTGSSAEMPVMLADTDSDVRLSDGPPQGMASDSDVRLVAPMSQESDSDVQLSDSDSDVRLSNSDSDVRLIPPAPSDSDVQLVDRTKKKKSSSDSDVTLLPKAGPKSGKSSGRKKMEYEASVSDSVLMEDSGMALEADSGIRLSGGSSIRLPGDSGISLTAPADSGILLEGDGESGFPLRGDSSLTQTGDDEPDISFEEDSGISIEDDSGITLETDSGIQLAGDSGIRLEAESGIRLDADSGIRLSDAPQSSIKRKKSPPLTDELDSSIPLLLAKEDGNRTDVEVPMLADSSELATLDLSPSKKKGGDTSVVMLEDDDSGTGLEDSSGHLDDDDAYGMSDGADDGELEVADDILGEDDELEQLEVFDSDDSVFDESFVEGGSAVGLPAMGSRIALPQEVEWTTGSVVLTGVSSLALMLGAVLAVDLLRVIWGNGSASVYQGELIGIFAGLFK